MVYKPTYNWGAPSCTIDPKNGGQIFKPPTQGRVVISWGDRSYRRTAPKVHLASRLHSSDATVVATDRRLNTPRGKNHRGAGQLSAAVTADGTQVMHNRKPISLGSDLTPSTETTP
jgi:hypothetical protein